MCAMKLLATVLVSVASLGYAGESPLAYRQPAAAPSRHLAIQSTTFRTADGKAFEWRGITAFRLVELVASGRRAAAVRFLDWAAARHLTVVRVLTMAEHLFELAPDAGVRALPSLLDLAAERGLYVEVVALADTADIPVNIDAHVKAIGAIAARHPNALVEIANEPSHPTQREALHEPGELQRLRALIPAVVPVALGSAEQNERFSAGDYATVHFPRASGKGGWGHVLALADGAPLVTRWKKPVVSDEPIGTATQSIPGRRDNDPARFRAAAVMTRLAGLGPTFHYEGGLQARIPAGRELQCFTAWSEAWTLLPADIERRGTFARAGGAGSSLRTSLHDGAAGFFERRDADRAWLAIVGVTGAPRLEWSDGWRAFRIRRFPGLWVIEATRGRGR